MVLGELIYGADVPERRTADLDPMAKQIIADAYAKAQESPSVQNGLINQDMKAGQDTFDTGFQSPDMDQAIKQKYSGILGSKLSDQGSALKFNARFKQISNVQRAQTALMAQTQVTNDIFAKNMEAQQMKEAARAEAINSILGFAGAVTGYSMAQSSKKKDPFEAGKKVPSFTDKNAMAAYDDNSPGRTRSNSYLEALRNDEF